MWHQTLNKMKCSNAQNARQHVRVLELFEIPEYSKCSNARMLGRSECSECSNVRNARNARQYRCLRNKSRPVRTGQDEPSQPHSLYFNVGFTGRRAVCKKRLFFHTPLHPQHRANIEIGGVGLTWLLLSSSDRATFISQTPVRLRALLGVAKASYI